MESKQTLYGHSIPVSDLSRSDCHIYDSWSKRVFTLLVISYTMYFLVRLNFSLAVPFIETEIGITKTQIGTIMTLSLLIFSFGKFFFGFLTHLSSPKVFLAIGLMGSSLSNILVAKSTSASWLTIIWSCNAAFQCLAWPQCVRLMSEWCSQQQLGTRWGFISLAYQFGSVIVFSCFTLLIDWYGWQACFFVPGVFGAITGFFVLLLPLETPTNLGLQSKYERFGIRESAKDSTSNSSSLAELISIAREILLSRSIWMVSLATFFVYVVKTGFCFWAPSYLNDTRHASAAMIGSYMLGFEGAGALGGFCAGWLSDAYFRGRRGPVAVLYFAGIFLFLIALMFCPQEAKLANGLLLAGLGFTLTGPQIMAGCASFEYSSKKAAVAANGFTGLFAGFGSAIISGAAVGFLAQYYGWSVVFLLLAACSVVAAWTFWKIC